MMHGLANFKCISELKIRKYMQFKYSKLIEFFLSFYVAVD